MNNTQIPEVSTDKIFRPYQPKGRRNIWLATYGQAYGLVFGLDPIEHFMYKGNWFISHSEFGDIYKEMFSVHPSFEYEFTQLAISLNSKNRYEKHALPYALVSKVFTPDKVKNCKQLWMNYLKEWLSENDTGVPLEILRNYNLSHNYIDRMSGAKRMLYAHLVDINWVGIYRDIE